MPLPADERDLGLRLLQAARERGVELWVQRDALTGQDHLRARGGSDSLRVSIHAHAQAVYEAMQAAPNPQPGYGAGGPLVDQPYVFGAPPSVDEPGVLDVAAVVRLEAYRERLRAQRWPDWQDTPRAGAEPLATQLGMDERYPHQSEETAQHGD